MILLGILIGIAATSLVFGICSTNQYNKGKTDERKKVCTELINDYNNSIAVACKDWDTVCDEWTKTQYQQERSEN